MKQMKSQATITNNNTSHTPNTSDNELNDNYEARSTDKQTKIPQMSATGNKFVDIENKIRIPIMIIFILTHLIYNIFSKCAVMLVKDKILTTFYLPSLFGSKQLVENANGKKKLSNYANKCKTTTAHHLLSCNFLSVLDKQMDTFESWQF